MNQKSISLVERAKGALLGLALGDALGTTLEFRPKDSYQHLTDMIGGGPFRLKPGQWTDDTAMMLCLADSFIHTGKNDIQDQVARYWSWYQDGLNSCTAECFDIGNTVKNALISFQNDGNAMAGSRSQYSAGNGSLMRIAPVALMYHSASITDAMTAAWFSGATTHGEPRCIQACQLMTFYIHKLLNSESQPSKDELFELPFFLLDTISSEWSEEIKYIALGEYKNKSRQQIKGTGFVVESLEAALWCFYQTHDFESGALLAANLGDDADTTAAIYGQLAGAYYGLSGLPANWLNKLAWKETIEEKAALLITTPMLAHEYTNFSLFKHEI